MVVAFAAQAESVRPQVMKRLALIAGLIAFAAILSPLWQFMETDACLDAGGRWEATVRECSGAPSGYRPLSERGLRPVAFIAVVAGVGAAIVCFVSYAVARVVTNFAGANDAV